MLQHDCLIWVGQSYPTISDYLNEAKVRGCCRKVPFWPAWARRGRTRIFLAHHDGLPAPDRGVIFGYFVLGGVDIILTPQDYDELSAVLATCREIDGDLGSPEHWATAAGERCAELMIEFWRKRAPDDPLPFKLKDWKGDLKDFSKFFLELFLTSGDGEGMGTSALALPTSQTALEKPRFCPVDGVRKAPEKSGRPSFYFVDSLARLVDEVFHGILEKEVERSLAENECGSRAECYDKLLGIAEAPDEDDRPQGLPQYQKAVEIASSLIASEDLRPAELHGFERRCGAMVMFRTPYPFYKSIPHASFRGLVQIDGDRLMQQIEKAYRHRSKSHEVKLPYVVEPSDKSTSKRKEELIVEMSSELKMSKSYSERVLDWLPEMLADELRSRAVIRLPNIGTFRIKRKAEKPVPARDLEDHIEFKPSRALEREFGEIEFKASRVLERRV